ncbi:MAG: efflux RND transporter periplasmic adaptor subunit [Pirellulaceae bacterium]
MSVPNSKMHATKSAAWFSTLQKIASAVVAVAAIGGSYWAMHHFLSDNQHDTEQNDEIVTGDRIDQLELKIASEKMARMDIKVEAASVKKLFPVELVPGVVQYDATRKVDIRAPVELVVIELFAEKGEVINKGQPLLKLSGAEIGVARVGINQALGEQKLASAEFEWARETNENLLELLDYLKTKPELKALNKQFENKSLGRHRTEILSAYSQWLLAQKVLERSTQPESSGVVPQKILDERKKELEVAEAQLTGLIEESKFQTIQDLERTRVAKEQSEKALDTAQEGLRSLLGPFHSDSDSESMQDSNGTRLGINDLQISAPMDGVIVDNLATTGARFQPGERMLTIANADKVWVEAQIPQQDLTMIRVNAGDAVKVTVPSQDDSTHNPLTGNVRFVASSVSSETLAVPLVIEIENQNADLRPGMLTWVEIPSGKELEALVVPETAIQSDGDEVFVFVQTQPDTFDKRFVETGAKAATLVEIKKGLRDGEKVVVNGAFYLKSESLLEAE